MLTILGQKIIDQELKTKDYIAINPGNLSSGAYIINIKTTNGEISKKVLIE